MPFSLGRVAQVDQLTVRDSLRVGDAWSIRETSDGSALALFSSEDATTPVVTFGAVSDALTRQEIEDLLSNFNVLLAEELQKKAAVVDLQNLSAFLNTTAAKYLVSTSLDATPSSNYVPSLALLQQVQAGVSATSDAIAALGSAATKNATLAIQAGLDALPTSAAVWLYLQPYIDEINKISQYGPPTPPPEVFQGEASGISITWNDPGEYLYTFANGLPPNAICSVSFERTYSYDGDAGNASK
eukprot:199652-Pleurochrysis_carterae.AAC.2